MPPTQDTGPDPGEAGPSGHQHLGEPYLQELEGADALHALEALEALALEDHDVLVDGLHVLRPRPRARPAQGGSDTALLRHITILDHRHTGVDQSGALSGQHTPLDHPLHL